MSDRLWEIFFTILGGAVSAGFGIWVFNRQKKDGAKENFIIFIETKKAEIPTNWFWDFKMEVQKQMRGEFAKVIPCLNNRQRTSFEKEWLAFCNIPLQALDAEKEKSQAWRSMNITSDPNPSDLLKSHFDALIKSIS